jgi:hypothetical protein
MKANENEMTETTKGKKFKAQIVKRQRNFTSVDGFSLFSKKQSPKKVRTTIYFQLPHINR